MARTKKQGTKYPGRVLNNTYDDLKDTPALLEDLLNTSPDDKYRALRDMLFDPKYKKLSFAQLCRKADVTLNEFVDLMRHYKVGEGILAGLNKVPQMVTDIATDALNKVVYCKTCFGQGKVSVNVATEDGPVCESRECPACEGSGKVVASGDTEARKLMIDIMGMGSKGPSPVTINQDFSGHRPPRMEDAIDLIVEEK